MSNFPTPLEEVIHHNVIKNNKTGGPALDIGPMQLLWRALGENTGYTFSIYETTVVPGMGIPLHKHPFAEFFYVLEGTLAFGSWNSQGAAEWNVYESGESLVVQPNAPHTFFNKSEHPCRMLSVFNVSPRADDEGCSATGWQDRFPACSTLSGRFCEVDKVHGKEPDIPCRRPCLVWAIS